MSRALLAATLALAVLPLSGCFGSGSGSFDFVPGKYKETGNTVHLKATVVDVAGAELYPGFRANLWAFCFEPVDPSDTYSADAIEEWHKLPNDGKTGTGGELPAGCSVPGPTLRVHQGDRVIVDFAHSHFHPHTIHWHGQYVPWEMDGAQGATQDAVVSGGTYTYDFIAKRAGTLWYHCHVDAPTHIMQGLYGMMIVLPQDTKYEPKDIGHEEVMVLGTMNRNAVEAVPGAGLHSHPPGCASGFPNCQNPATQAGHPDVFLINGHGYPYTEEQDQSIVHIKPGERVRLRILNAGETFEEIHLHGHDMQVVAQDGNPLSPSARYYVDTLPIGPAQRFDVVITGDNPGVWLLHTHVDSHDTNCDMFPGGMHTMLVYDGFMDQMHKFQSELPAACAFGSQMQLPSDFVNQTSIALGTIVGGASPAASRDWAFPVQLPCAVRSLTVTAHLDSASSGPVPAPSQTSAHLTLAKPAGSAEPEAADVTLDTAHPDFTYYIEKKALTGITTVPGNYTVHVGSAQAVQGSVGLFVRVDYYETFEQSKTAHLTYKVGGCPGYT